MINLLEMGKFEYPSSNIYAIKTITDDPNNLQVSSWEIVTCPLLTFVTLLQQWESHRKWFDCSVLSSRSFEIIKYQSHNIFN